MLIETLVKYGVENVREHCQIVPGIPLKPMLAYPTKGIHEVLKRFDQALLTCEYKYDGERAQIHILEDGSVRIYSRNSENNTSKYPDIIEFLQQDMLKLKKKTDKKDDKEEKEDEEKSENKVTSAIIDAEVVAYDTEKHIIQPFQKLTTRKRKVYNYFKILDKLLIAYSIFFILRTRQAKTSKCKCAYSHSIWST